MSDPNPWPSKFQRQLDLANKQISIVSWGIDFRYRVGSGYKLGRECVPYKLIQEFGDAAIIQSDVRSTWKSDPNGKYTLEEMCQTAECKELLGQLQRQASLYDSCLLPCVDAGLLQCIGGAVSHNEVEDLGVAIQNYLEDTRLYWLEDLRAANADQCLKATPKQTETQKNDDGPDEWVPWMHLPWMHLPWMHITFTNAQLLPLDIPQVRQQLRQEACLNLAMYNDEGRDYAKNLATKLGRPFA
ncbi:unnamed protein product [Cladocopium goreaui]|uniref:Uncharacterized protein n=1 Tax=Cladocopium goreaui TaxID=2562237 RepID=A0A9P1FIT0_9DINO|nr:unnamed protein product [Cladocopium goreaui]CAI3991416.1 unnamed protein product [Cladocopium goreaui]